MKKTLIFLLVVFAATFANAQKVGIKTNLLYDATASANLGLEFGLAPKWTLDISGNYNAWPINDHKWKHWFVQPEARYWLCNRFQGHFFALHAIGGQYNFGNLPGGFKFLGSDFRKLNDHRYQGWGAGGGIGYGYAWVLGKHWNFEAEIAIGAIYTKYDIYDCESCSRKIGNGDHVYYGPTKLALSFEYLF
ncbi:MAG: DUF3575 domain-containing protein [Muribaculaceae bacterium]|nr:DUF3575 domain-containing protein [Muribaculaceae bacterium]